uniref:protein BUNDLE SHEATH DEFECTIVE 2, chloroplastic n=1 Tax=Erigeron canadensis TaxID=72917 RepID=UPI001CB97057|nr:protein BUNDLE SHEATH DEFECTIVE 2, chloroplastic [Erigeron canadensis]
MNSTTSCCCSSNTCYNPLLISTKRLVTGIRCHLRRHGGVTLIRKRVHGGGFCGVKASMVEPSSSSSSEENSASFSKRMEQAWLISQQPRPVACSSCESNGHVECKWCGGTGFFILGDNMLCQVPSRSTSCVICAGKGSTSCGDCKGTGFRAKWLEQPPVQ